MARQACILCYDSIRTCDKSRKVRKKAFYTLLDCKKIRESLGGENYHVEQCRNLPKVLKKINTLIIENAVENSPVQTHLNEKENEQRWQPW